MKAVISVIGKDKVGILAMIANECANYNLNVLDVTQTIVDSMFTMTMMVAIDEMSIPLNEFAERMENLGKEKNLVIRCMHQDIFNSMHKINFRALCSKIRCRFYWWIFCTRTKRICGRRQCVD